MSIVYDYFGGLYINLTNRCPCRCEFCIKNFTDSLGSADSLMLDREPSVEEVLKELKSWPMDRYDEVIFCGYGEPTERLDDMLTIARHVKETYHKPIRLNTIGLADLIWERKTLPEMAGLIDAVSISLNEADAESFQRLCHPRFGLQAYDSICRYIEEARDYIPDVTVSVVGGSLSAAAQEKCRQMAEDWGVAFRVR